jgi:hypothetical protein
MASGALDSSDVIQVLSHFCFRSGSFYAYDDRTAVVVRKDIGLRCAIRGDQLLALLKPIKGEVDITQNGDTVTITAGRRKASLATLPESSFLLNDDFAYTDDSHEIQLTDQMLDGMVLACEGVSKRPLNANWSGVNLVEENDGGYFNICSTDNMTLATIPVLKVKSKWTGEPPTTAIIPVPAIKQMARIRTKLKANEDSDGRTLWITPRGVTAIFYWDESKSWGDSKSYVRVVARTVKPTARQSLTELRDRFVRDATWRKIPDGFTDTLSRAIAAARSDPEAVLCVAVDGDLLALSLDAVTAKIHDEYELQPLMAKPFDEFSDHTVRVYVKPRHVERYASDADSFTVVPDSALCFRRGDAQEGDASYFIIGGISAPQQLSRG